ncbi:MAG: nucleotidyltransferase family protein [Euryarchaeota archaeon]|nr:nucleotidyltransferase family protein [Euryarchaeota archaeon]
MHKRIKLEPKELRAFCKAHHISRLSVFGSALRDDFRPDSDIDVLVEFEPGHTPSLFRLAEMQREFSALAGNRQVDMRTPDDLSPYFRERVVKAAEVQYAEA